MLSSNKPPALGDEMRNVTTYFLRHRRVSAQTYAEGLKRYPARDFEGAAEQFVPGVRAAARAAAAR
jgi:hypothetical protein